MMQARGAETSQARKGAGNHGQEERKVGMQGTVRFLASGSEFFPEAEGQN